MTPPKIRLPRPEALATATVPKTRPGGSGATPDRGRTAPPSNAAVAAALSGGPGPVAHGPGPRGAPPAGPTGAGNGAVAAALQTLPAPGPAPQAAPATAPAAPRSAVSPVSSTTAPPPGAGPAAPQRPAPAEQPGGGERSGGGGGQAGGAGRRPGPHADPKFAALKADVSRKKRSVATSHPPARTEAGAAQDAALPPKDDAVAQGKAANAEKMNAAEPKSFDKEAFIQAVEKAIAAKAPKNLDEADKFADSGKADEVRAEVKGSVDEGRTESAEQIATTTAAAPDTSAAQQKKVVPLTGDRPPGTPAPPDASKAAPDRLPPSATDMSEGPARVNREMSGAQVTERQLKRANEPTFTRALGDKKAAERHSATAPRQLRRHEADELRTTTADAQRSGATAMGAMAAQRVTTGQGVGSGKGRAKSRDEEKRAQVTALLQGVFDTMKKDVESILEGLEKRVDDQFTRGEKEARDAFTAEHRRKMEEYKDRRYSGVIGKFRWIRDLFVGLPAEADRIFDDARAGYLRRMRQVISDVATTIGSELDRAKRRIAQGRTELQAAVRRLPTDLRAIGAEAATEFQGRFDDLAQSVDDKATQLVDTLADKYTEALKSVDAEIAKEREKNQGLVQKAVKAIISVIDTIRELGRLLGAVLAKAAGAVMMILRDPIGFLGNLVRGVGAGLRQFQQNIGRHLQQGIMSWLLGRATEAGLQLPEKFDARGVFTLLAGLLGLTWASIRARITRRVPEAAVAAAESAVPLVAAVRRQGIAGLWDDIRARVGDLRKTLVDKVIDYVVPTLVVAGIAWILSLLNPASAFVRAVKLIIDVITFIVTQARQVIAFMNAVLDAVIAIAKGGAGGVPGLVERALAGSIPLLLGFLAALLGIGGIAARVRQIVQAMARPVQMAVDWVVDRIVGLVQRLWRSLKAKGTSLGRGKAAGQGPGGGSGRGRGKDSGRDSSSGRDKDRGKGKDKDKGKDADAQRKRLTKAMAAAVSAVNRFRGRVVGKFALNALFPLIRRRYGLTSLTAVEKGGFWAVRGVINPVATEMTQAQVLGEMKAYQKQHQDSTFTAAEKAELTQLMKDLEGGKFTKEAAHKKFKELIERSRARREKYVAAEMSEEKRHTVPEKSGKEMDKIEAERQRLKGLREPENKERTQLAKKMGHNNPDKVDRAALAEQRRLGNAKDVDAFEKADKKYKELGTELTGESEKLGMHAAEDFARSKGGVDFYKGAPGKAGTLDLVKLKPGNPPTLIICEAKGGSSTLGTRAIGGQDYQQGRPEYLEWMLKNDKDFHKAAEEHGLLQRIKNRELPVEYYLVTASGGRNVTVREFKKQPAFPRLTGGSMRRLTPEQGVEAARRLDSHDWSWTIQELGPALEAFGLVPLDPLDGPSLRTDNPELPGVHGFVVNLQDEGLVLEVAVNLTDVDPAKSEESLASFESAFMDYLVALTGAFGPPDGAESSKVVFWDRGDEVLMLRNLNICVDLARLSKNSVRIREGG